MHGLVYADAKIQLRVKGGQESKSNVKAEIIAFGSTEVDLFNFSPRTKLRIFRLEPEYSLIFKLANIYW